MQTITVYYSNHYIYIFLFFTIMLSIPGSNPPVAIYILLETQMNQVASTF